MLTDIPGSSAWFLGGVVAYSNTLKKSLLGVLPSTLASHGAVSESAAREMAIGALETLGGDVAAAVTGIAGPDGGQPEESQWARSGSAGPGTTAIRSKRGSRSRLSAATAKLCGAAQSSVRCASCRTLRQMPLSRGEPPRRLFFALWPPDGLREKIQEATRQVTTAQRGRVIPAANLHITIAFLGEIAQERVQAAVDAGAATQAPVFGLCLDRIEAMRRSRVLCLVPTSAPRFSRQVRRSIAIQSVRSTIQAPTPGVQAARDADARPVARADAVGIAPLHWHVDSFALVESQLGRTGSQYSVLQRWKRGREGASGQKNDQKNDDGNDSGR